jgi:hypothetical protein
LRLEAALRFYQVIEFCWILQVHGMASSGNNFSAGVRDAAQEFNRVAQGAFGLAFAIENQRGTVDLF